jgi:hypothetical protein
MFKSRVATFAAVGLGAYLLYRWNYTDKNGAAQLPLPQGARPTGRVETTVTGVPPGFEAIGHTVKRWAEVNLPSGAVDWIEVRK